MVNSAIILELYPSQLRSYRLVPHQYQCSSLGPECECCPIQLPPLTHKVLSANIRILIMVPSVDAEPHPALQTHTQCTLFSWPLILMSAKCVHTCIHIRIYIQVSYLRLTYLYIHISAVFRNFFKGGQD